MRFRPCIDLHEGRVKQIVGSSLRDDRATPPITNFESSRPPAYYAHMYWRDGLAGGHVIMLGPGNEEAAREALGKHPGFLQVGGGIDPGNGPVWISRGADKVIVTSYVFEQGELDMGRLRDMCLAVGRERLVLDLSCRFRDGRYRVVCDRWQTFTSLPVSAATLGTLADYCAEFLVHAVDLEGKRCGVDSRLIELLSSCSPLPTTYAGGIRCEEDIEILSRAGGGALDFTVGSALDIFGGETLAYSRLAELYGGRPSSP